MKLSRYTLKNLVKSKGFYWNEHNVETISTITLLFYYFFHILCLFILCSATFVSHSLKCSQTILLSY